MIRCCTNDFYIIESCLSGRLQSVVLNGITSYFVDVLRAVSQGSVMGPLLFIIYINDIEGLTNRILKFVDDTKLFGVVTNGKNEGRSIQTK